MNYTEEGPRELDKGNKMTYELYGDQDCGTHDLPRGL